MRYMVTILIHVSIIVRDVVDWSYMKSTYNFIVTLGLTLRYYDSQNIGMESGEKKYYLLLNLMHSSSMIYITCSLQRKLPWKTTIVNEAFDFLKIASSSHSIEIWNGLTFLHIINF